MQVESVSYISASGSVLFFLFGIIALHLSRKNNDNPTKVTIVIQYLLLLAGSLIKETGILFIFIILLYQFINKKKAFTCLWYSCATVLAYFLIRFGIGNVFIESRPIIPIARIDFFERLMTMPQVFFYYIKTFFYPATLAVDQQWVVTLPTIRNFYLPLTLDIFFLAGLTRIGVLLYKKSHKNFKIYLFFTIWFFIGFVLHSQIFPLDGTVADRWFYFDMAGLLGIMGVLLRTIKASILHQLRYKLIYAAIIILLIFSIRTIIRNNDWQNSLTLFTHDIKIENNFLIQGEYASALARNGEFKKALGPAKKSVDSFPYELNLYNLGYIYEKSGNIPKAKETYIKALNAKAYKSTEHRHYEVLYIRLGNIFLKYEDPKHSVTFITDALKDYPRSSRLWLLLSIAEYKFGHNDVALSHAQHALSLAPNDGIANYVYQKLLNNQPIEITL